jgi:transcriptional regulator with XRE-family HTH domain
MDTLGKRIKHIINFNKKTMTDFAKSINISQSMVSKICADKAIPSARTLHDICRIYNVSYSWLQYNAGSMEDPSVADREFVAFNKFLEEIGYSSKLELSIDNPECNWSLYDYQSGMKYAVSGNELDNLMHDIVAYSKFQIASLISKSTPIH